MFEFKTVTPIYDRIQIRKAKPITKSGRIHLGKESEIQLALVVEVGAGRNFDGHGVLETLAKSPASGEWDVVSRQVRHKKPCLVKAGDWILIGKYSGHEIHLDPQKPATIILREDEVLAVVTFPEGQALPPLEGDPEPVEEPVNLDQYRQEKDPADGDADEKNE